MKRLLRIVIEFIIKTNDNHEIIKIISMHIFFGVQLNKRTGVDFFSIILDFDLAESHSFRKYFLSAIYDCLVPLFTNRDSLPYKEIINIFTLINKYPEILIPKILLPSLFTSFLSLKKIYDTPQSYTLITDLIAEAKKIFSPGIAVSLQPIEKTIVYLESGENDTVLQKMEPEMQVTVKEILKNIKEPG